jgi:hypothetical protein
MRRHSLLHKVALGSQEGMRSIRSVSVPSFRNYESLIGMETEVEEIPLVVCIYSGTVLRICSCSWYGKFAPVPKYVVGYGDAKVSFHAV